MAVVNHVTTALSSNNTTSYATTSFTPTAGSLMVVCVSASGTVINPGTCVSSDGTTFTLVNRALYSASANLLAMYVANTFSNAAPQTITWGCVGDAATGANIWVAEITGMTRKGLNAVLQSAVQSNQASGGTPAPTLSAAANTNNPLIGCIGNSTNPAGMTAPAGWTDLANDIGYNTPATGLEVPKINSGFTGTTVTWGSTSPSVFASLVAEFDSSVPPAMGLQHIVEGIGDTGVHAGRIPQTLHTIDHGISCDLSEAA